MCELNLGEMFKYCIESGGEGGRWGKKSRKRESNSKLEKGEHVTGEKGCTCFEGE